MVAQARARAAESASVYDRVAFDGIEVANSTPLLFFANFRARRYQSSHAERLACTGGSDAHILSVDRHEPHARIRGAGVRRSAGAPSRVARAGGCGPSFSAAARLPLRAQGPGDHASATPSARPARPRAATLARRAARDASRRRRRRPSASPVLHRRIRRLGASRRAAPSCVPAPRAPRGRSSRTRSSSGGTCPVRASDASPPGSGRVKSTPNELDPCLGSRGFAFDRDRLGVLIRTHA